MQKLSDQVIHFFNKQGFAIVSSTDKKGFPHTSCKGIVKISPDGRVYLFDLYRANTYNNLELNPRISITAVDEHKFSGYCLKGVASVIGADEIDPALLSAWEDRVASRLTQRLLKNIHEEKGHLRHPEASLPGPKYLIVMDVEEIVDLTPQHLK